MFEPTKQPATWICAALMAWSTATTAATPTDFKSTPDRDDYEMGLFRDDTDPAALCEYGTLNRRYPSPASACRAAYDAAMKSRAYAQATRHAALGCEAFHDDNLCRALPKIPFPRAQDSAASR